MGTILKPRPVSVGTFHSTDRMKTLVWTALDSGQISYGSLSKEFERQFAQLHGCHYAILSNSGTSSLQVALQALKEAHNWQDGDRVIVPATTFVATANIVRHNRLMPVFVDVDPLTYNIDVEHVAEVLEGGDSPFIKAIIPVHLFGQPADVQGLRQVIGTRNIKIIEDSCECMFATHHGRPVGSLGDIGCFSTYVAHIIVTGVGGIATTNNPDYAARMRSLVNHGLDINQLNPDDNFSPQPTPGRRFRFCSYGHSFRITELEAALGLAQLENIGEIVGIRQRNARHLSAGLKIFNQHHDYPLQLPTLLDSNTRVPMMYPIVVNRKDGQIVDKEPLIAWLNAHQIETRDMLPILGHPIYNWLSVKSYPVSHWLERSGFYVGCHQSMTSEDCQYVVQTIQEFYERP